VNAAWPWIESAAMTRILNLTSKYMRKSEFAAASAVPVLDPNTRTFTLFAPGALAKLDPAEWLVWRVDLPQGVGVPNSSGGNLGMGGLGGLGVPRCRVPCDHVPIRSWAFFRAREVMRGVIESFKAEQPK
jgi:hypothetical protein